MATLYECFWSFAYVNLYNYKTIYFAMAWKIVWFLIEGLIISLLSLIGSGHLFWKIIPWTFIHFAELFRGDTQQQINNYCVKNKVLMRYDPLILRECNDLWINWIQLAAKMKSFGYNFFNDLELSAIRRKWVFIHLLLFLFKQNKLLADYRLIDLFFNCVLHLHYIYERFITANETMISF